MAKRGTRYPVGTKLTSICGIEVTIVEKDGDWVWLEDACGYRKKFNRCVFLVGFHWRVVTSNQNVLAYQRENTLKEGEIVLLECGVNVEIVQITRGKYAYRKKVTVKDRLNNMLTVGEQHIKHKTCTWPFFLPENTGWNLEDKTYLTREGVEIRIKSPHTDVGKYVMVDMEGNTKICTQSLVQRERVNWKTNSDMAVYYVYFATLGDTIYYIGNGKGPRSEHVNSGKSSSVLLNIHFFSDKEKLKVEIVHKGLTKKEANKLEKSLIAKYNPVYNVLHKTEGVNQNS